MEPFIGQIIMFGGNFAPRSWAFCDGQLLAISSNTALFSILGTTYGGDGRTTFALPELRGRVAIHAGNGPGLSNYNLGQKSGTETVTLNSNQMPSHTHTLRAHSEDAEETNPSGHRLGGTGTAIYASEAADVNMSGDSVTNTGGNQAHTNIQPYNTVNYIIALLGTYPSRS